MRSAASEARRSGSARASLAGRVAVASALAAALGGVVAALVAGISSVELVDAHEDAMLAAAAAELADEVEDELNDDDDRESDGAPRIAEVPVVDPLEAALVDELEETPLAGARAVIRAGGHAIAGDATIEGPPIGECGTFERASGAAVRACSVAFGGGALTLAVGAAESEHQRDLVALGALLGMVVGALASAAMSRRFAGWALSPLADLRARVATILPDAPRSDRIAQRYPYAELEELRATVADLVDRLGASLAQAQAFAGEAAHELRTPLAALAAELELLADAGDVRASAESLERSRRRVGELVSLVQRLLVLARPGRLDGRSAEAVDLGDVVLAAAELVPDALRSRVDVEAEDDLLVRGDAELLRALISNALDNALKFAEGRVRVRAFRLGGERAFEVSDDGPGLDRSERERVFAPFYRAAAARAGGKPGHGVGLALIAHVAAAHGGRAEFLDVPRGATLQVRLPAWTAIEEPPDAR